MQKVGSRVVAKLEAKQASFAIDTEIQPEMPMQLVVQLSAFTNARHPVLEQLHVGVRSYIHHPTQNSRH